MMDKIKILTAIFCLGMTLCSCNTKNAAINDLRSFQQDIAAKGQTYTIEQWKDAKEQFEIINSKIEKNIDKYTAEEFEEIGRLQGKCLTAFGKSVIGNIKDKVNSASSALKGFIDGIMQK